MKIQKLPLTERIRRVESGRSAYPEYIPSMIACFGETPVWEYLAELDASQRERFRDLIGPSCDGSTYQQAAQRIRRLYRTSPASAAEAMRILAAPMARYDDLIHQKNVPPLVRYGTDFAAPGREALPPERTIQKLPLGDRLRRAAAKQGGAACPPVYRLNVNEFFDSLDDLFSSDSAYSDILDMVLASFLEQYAETPLLTTFIADSRNLSDMEQTQLLYQTLIQPFAELQNEKERMNHKCMSPPF